MKALPKSHAISAIPHPQPIQAPNHAIIKRSLGGRRCAPCPACPSSEDEEDSDNQEDCEKNDKAYETTRMMGSIQETRDNRTGRQHQRDDPCNHGATSVHPVPPFHSIGAIVRFLCQKRQTLTPAGSQSRAHGS